MPFKDFELLAIDHIQDCVKLAYSVHTFQPMFKTKNTTPKFKFNELVKWLHQNSRGGTHLFVGTMYPGQAGGLGNMIYSPLDYNGIICLSHMLQPLQDEAPSESLGGAGQARSGGRTQAVQKSSAVQQSSCGCGKETISYQCTCERCGVDGKQLGRSAWYRHNPVRVRGLQGEKLEHPSHLKGSYGGDVPVHKFKLCLCQQSPINTLYHSSKAKPLESVWKI